MMKNSANSQPLIRNILVLNMMPTDCLCIEDDIKKKFPISYHVVLLA